MAEPTMPAAGLAVQITSLEGFNRTGVYFLYHEGVVVYVGQAVNVRKRVADHIGDGVKVFDAVSFLACKREYLDSVERRYIRLLGPKYNSCSVAKAVKEQPNFSPIAISGPIVTDIFSRRSCLPDRIGRLRERAHARREAMRAA